MSSVFDQSVPLNAGPWYIGELLTGVYGLVGVHGVIVAGHFLPGSLTYLNGVLQVRRGEKMVLFSATKEEEEVKEVFSALIFSFHLLPPSCFDCPVCAGATVPSSLGVLPQFPSFTRPQPWLLPPPLPPLHAGCLLPAAVYVNLEHHSVWPCGSPHQSRSILVSSSEPLSHHSSS